MYAKFYDNVANAIEVGLLGSGEDNDYNGVGSVEISGIFAKLEDFFAGTLLVDRVSLSEHPTSHRGPI